MKKWHKAEIQHLKGGTVRAEFPGINVAKNQSVTIRHLFGNTVHAQNLYKVWVKKNGRLLTFLIFLKGNIKEFLIEKIESLIRRIEGW